MNLVKFRNLRLALIRRKKSWTQMLWSINSSAEYLMKLLFHKSMQSQAGRWPCCNAQTYFIIATLKENHSTFYTVLKTVMQLNLRIFRKNYMNQARSSLQSLNSFWKKMMLQANTYFAIYWVRCIREVQKACLWATSTSTYLPWQSSKGNSWKHCCRISLPSNWI